MTGKPWCAAEVKARELTGLKSIVNDSSWPEPRFHTINLNRVTYDKTFPKTQEIKKMNKKELQDTIRLMQENIKSLRVIKSRQDDDLDTAKRYFNDELERIERESSDPKVEKKILAKLRDGKAVVDKSRVDVQFKRAVMNLTHKGLLTNRQWDDTLQLSDAAKDYEELL